MRTPHRIVLVLITAVVWGASAIEASGQTVEIVELDLGVPEIMEGLRHPDDGRAAPMLGYLYERLRTEEWERPRLDSLSAGVAEVIIEGRPGWISAPLRAILVRLGPDGRPVGSFEQMRRIYEADPSGLSRSLTLEKIGVYGEDPRAVAYLTRIATRPDEGVSIADRLGALRGLAASEAGRSELAPPPAR